MLNIISNAYAASSGAVGAGPENSMASLLLPIVVIAGLYFIMLRPQLKRAKEQRNLTANLNKGDEVVTSGGIMGKINKLTDDYMVLEIADNVEIKMQRNAVIAVLPKGTIKAI